MHKIWTFTAIDITAGYLINFMWLLFEMWRPFQYNIPMDSSGIDAVAITVGFGTFGWQHSSPARQLSTCERITVFGAQMGNCRLLMHWYGHSRGHFFMEFEFKSLKLVPFWHIPEMGFCNFRLSTSHDIPQSHMIWLPAMTLQLIKLK